MTFTHFLSASGLEQTCESERRCHVTREKITKTTGNGSPRGTEKSRMRKTVIRGEVGGGAGKGAELGKVGGEMTRADERRVRIAIGGSVSE